jgi:hypothetical protein
MYAIPEAMAHQEFYDLAYSNLQVVLIHGGCHSA